VRGARVLDRLGPTRAPTPFQTAGWRRAWITRAAHSEAATPILVETGLPGGRGRVSVGLQLHDTAAGPVLRPLSWPWADYHDACDTTADDTMVCGHPDAARVLAEAIDDLQRAERARLDLPDLVAGGLLHRAAIRLGAQVRPSSTVVSIDLGDAHHVRSIVNRKETVRKARRLARLGTVSLVHLREPADVVARLPVFFAMHAAQWRDRVDVVAPFDGGVADQTFAAVAAQPDAGVVLTELRLDSAPVAMYFGFLYRRRYWAYRTAFDRGHWRESPGHQLVTRMITDFVRSAVHTFDLMRGGYPYKLEYASRVSVNARAERGRP
jgi:CelD/BcsL family acetyltransferase involved in cellulose biosynthesis